LVIIGEKNELYALLSFGQYDYSAVFSMPAILPEYFSLSHINTFSSGSK